MKRLVAAAAVTALLLNPVVYAGPMPEDVVPDDAVWAVHADFQALRNSRLGEALLEDWNERFASEQVQQISDIVGIDLVRDILSATLYGDGTSHDATAIVVTLLGGTGNLEGLMLAAPAYEIDEIDGRTVHSFLTEDEHGERRLHVAMQTRGSDRDLRQRNDRAPSRVVAAHDPDVLAELLDRLEDQAITRDAPQADTFLTARLDEVNPAMLDEHEQHSAVIQTIQNLALEVSETEGTVAAVLEAQVVDEQRAEQVRQLVQGLLAMTQMSAHQGEMQAMLAEFARQTVVQREGEAVNLRLGVPSERVIEMLEQHPSLAK
jgi:hypothetical protein